VGKAPLTGRGGPRLRYVLFPGRHHLLTRFQADYLRGLGAGQAFDEIGEPIATEQPVTVVWAVTSADHGNTRRNPIPYDRREAAIERFSLAEGLRSLVVPVFDTPPTDRFAEITLKNIENATAERLALTPANCVVACSTPEVIELYRGLGFRIAPVELGHPDRPHRPWNVLTLLAEGDPGWRELAHPASVDVFERYGLADHVRLIHNDPIVGDEGGLTETRSYRTYIEAFEKSAARKWAQAAPHVRPGRIVDVGCATGATLELAAADPRLHESDLIGIEIDRRLFEECVHRKAQGAFANPNTFFYQRNILAGSVLPDRSVNTTLTFALTHEVFSYGDGETSLAAFADTVYRHTAPGGVWINSDVCGPSARDREVLLRFKDEGGETPEGPRDLGGLAGEDVRAYVESLSNMGRFVQFARDFQRHTGAEFPYHVRADGAISLRLGDAMEFLLHKDYTDNWLSESHELFCALTYDDWGRLLEKAGFELAPGSRAWRNDWIVSNRLAPLAALETLEGTQLAWPATHVFLVARRPLNT
jgi:SAM-dependent methyltransferase